MYAKKANKVYRVDDMTKETYLKQGYDICDDKGNVIEHSPQSTIPYTEYAKVVKELEALKTSDKTDSKKADKKAESKSEQG